jgi:hypothetical protein
MKRGSLFWGIVFMLLGGLLLLNNFNIIRIDIWRVFWPLLIILLGVWILWQAQYGGSAIETETLSLPVDGASEAKITMHHGAGELRVAGGIVGGDLFSGSFDGGVECAHDRRADRMDVTLRVPTQGFPFVFFPWLWGPDSRIRWDVTLNNEIPIALAVHSGANDARLDLRALQVKELVLKTGASSTEVITPSQMSHTFVKIEAGAASVKVQVPEGVAASVRVDGGLLGVDIDQSRFPRNDDKAYQSPDFDSAAYRVEIKVEAGAGSVTVS